MKSRILCLFLSAVILLSLTAGFTAAYAVPGSTEEPAATSSADGEDNGSESDRPSPTSSPSASASPSSSPAAESGESAEASAAPSATANPRVDESGRPILPDRETAILLDRNTGDVLFEKDADKRMYPASTTKIMTALLVLEAIDRNELNLESSYRITADMLEGLPADGSSMSLKVGEAITVQYLLDGLLVASGNDAAQALAIIVCGDIETFVQRMNDKAAELGLENTHYVNPHGLHDEDHYTTARDLATVTQQAMEYPTFREIVAMPQVVIPESEGNVRRALISTNGLISTLRYSDYYYQYATGVKTGRTTEAGNCLVSSATNGNMNVLGVVMNGAEVNDSHTDSLNMLKYALDNFKTITPISKGEMLSEVKVKQGAGAGNDHVTLSTSDNVVVTVENDVDASQLEIEYDLPENIYAPVEMGQVVGTVNIKLDGETIGSGELVADKSIERHKLGFLMSAGEYIWSFWFVRVLVVLIGLAIVVFVIYVIVGIRRELRRVKKYRNGKAKRPKKPKRYN